jgi:uncharacterized protein involved in exopolysaccharide biosynthesis
MEPTSDFDLKRVVRLVYRKKQHFFAAAAVISTLIVVVGYLMPKTYEARSVIFIERNVLNELIKDVTVTSSFEEKVKALTVVMKSRSLILKVMNELDLDVKQRTPNEVEGMIRGFQENTEITIELSRQRDMDLFTVSYKNSNPTLASNFVNGLVRRYIEENLSMKRDEAYGASRFLVDQISSFKQKLEKIEVAIARQRKDGRPAVPEKGVTPYDRLQELLARKEALLVQYTESHPEVVRIKSEIEHLRSQIKVSDQFAVGPDRILIDLERERETTKKIYEDLMATLRRSEVSTQLEVQDKAGAFRIIDPAVVPTKPLSPNMGRIALLSILGGVGAAFGLLLLADQMDRTVKTVDTLKKMGMPVLAVISTIRTEREAAADRKKDGMVYAAAGLYLALLVTVATVESLGYSFIDNFVQTTRAEISNSVKKIWASK